MAAGVGYLRSMSHPAISVRLIQTALLSFGLSTLSTHAAEMVSSAPPARATNIVAQRVVGDVIQTLLKVTPADNPAAPTNTATLPGYGFVTNADGRRIWRPYPRPSFKALKGPSAPGGSAPIRPSHLQSNIFWAAVAEQARAGGFTLITNVFAGFVPGSLAETVWAGFQTNGRSTRMWEFWKLPPGWPTNPPVLRWDTNNLMWGRKGMTGISQVWEDMGAFGQVSITALTPRHGYLRGHSMGPSGLAPTRVGRRVWFCTRDNQVIERRVQLLLVRGRDVPDQGDYSIILFDADLPPGIEPLRVVDAAKLRRKYNFGEYNHHPVFMTLQGGSVSARIPGWNVEFGGGDSGAPLMVPLPGELVFFQGISTSPPSAKMQADMDMLSRRAGLDPRRYQMKWVDLDAYPDF
jgi:hypothetical protein